MTLINKCKQKNKKEKEKELKAIEYNDYYTKVIAEKISYANWTSKYKTIEDNATLKEFILKNPRILNYMTEVLDDIILCFNKKEIMDIVNANGVSYKIKAKFKKYILNKDITTTVSLNQYKN